MRGTTHHVGAVVPIFFSAASANASLVGSHSVRGRKDARAVGPGLLAMLLRQRRTTVTFAACELSRTVTVAVGYDGQVTNGITDGQTCQSAEGQAGGEVQK